jgi:hypothetical protein
LGVTPHGMPATHAVFSPLLPGTQIRQWAICDLRERGVEIDKSDEGWAGRARGNLAGGPRDDERHPVATLKNGAFVAAKGARGDVAIFLCAVVAGEDDDGVGEEFVAGTTGIRSGGQPVDEPAQSHVVFVDVVVSCIHWLARFRA